MSTFYFLEVRSISKQELPINEEIKEKEIRVIDADGSQLGIMALDEALKKSAEKDLDLVMIAPNAKPAVCKIMDYGKYKFEQTKKEKEMRKNQKVVETKEIRLGLSTDVHDFETKGNHAVKFLKSGNKVTLNLGYSHPVVIEETDAIKLDVPQPNKIVISGIDKQAVGQFAAEVREKRPPEPYKGKGIRYAGEHIIRKEGKAGKGKK